MSTQTLHEIILDKVKLLERMERFIVIANYDRKFYTLAQAASSLKIKKDVAFATIKKLCQINAIKPDFHRQLGIFVVDRQLPNWLDEIIIQHNFRHNIIKGGLALRNLITSNVTSVNYKTELAEKLLELYPKDYNNLATDLNVMLKERYSKIANDMSEVLTQTGFYTKPITIAIADPNASARDCHGNLYGWSRQHFGDSSGDCYFMMDYAAIELDKVAAVNFDTDHYQPVKLVSGSIVDADITDKFNDMVEGLARKGIQLLRTSPFIDSQSSIKNTIFHFVVEGELGIVIQLFIKGCGVSIA